MLHGPILPARIVASTESRVHEAGVEFAVEVTGATASATAESGTARLSCSESIDSKLDWVLEANVDSAF